MEHFKSLSYDGFGINGRDEFRTRISTFAASLTEEQRAEFGPLFAAAPELLAVVKDYSEDILSDEEGTRRACCGAEWSDARSYMGKDNPHKPDCAAVAALNAARGIK